MTYRRIKKHYFPLILITLLAGFIFHFFVWPKADAIILVTDTTGYISLFLTSFSLILGTLRLIRKQKNPVSTYYRRDIGIFAGLLAVIHSVVGLFAHLRGNNWQYFLIKTGDKYAIRLDKFGLANYFGVLAALLIILLLITSNDYMLKKLKPEKWKNIQRSIYIMFVLVFIHSIYYLIVKNNAQPIYYLYVPLFLFVFIFQMTGVRLKIRNRRINNHR